MSKEELLALGSDIKQNGMQVPVVLFDDTLGDGRNRLDAMELVGLEVILSHADGVTMFGPEVPIRYAEESEDLVASIISANIHRRHLTPAKKRELIANLLKAQPSKAIAPSLKSLRLTTRPCRSSGGKLESTEAIPQSPKRTGKDGKARTAKRSSGPAVADKVLRCSRRGTDNTRRPSENGGAEPPDITVVHDTANVGVTKTPVGEMTTGDRMPP